MILAEFIKTRFFLWRVDSAYQSRLWKKQLAFLRKRSRFYKTTTPAANKRILMDNFNDINTVGIDKEQAADFAIACEKTRRFDKKLNGVTVGLSSGTSGHRGVFLVSDREKALWAGNILAKMLPENHLFGVRVAFFMRADSELYQTISSRIIKFKFFDMYGDMNRNLEELREFQPTLLVAPPSMLLQIAKAIPAPQLKPKRVISIAEVLEKQDCELLKRAFGVDVIHQIYQCTEGFLGATCKYGTLHINEDIVRIDKEYIEGRRFYPIITDLRRRALPIVNYKLNDILVERKTPCPCGSRFLAIDKIEGRQDDVFEFGGVTVFPDFIRRCMMFVENINEYRVQQSAADEISILMDIKDEATKEKIIAEFEKLAKDLDFPAPRLKFAAYKFDISKKLKRVEKLC